MFPFERTHPCTSAPSSHDGEKQCKLRQLSHSQTQLRTNTASRSRRPKRARFAINFGPPKSEGAGNAGRRCARSRACSVVNTRVSHHGHTGLTRHSPRNGFNCLLRALPGDRALLPPSSLRSLLLKNLTPASRRQDHTTSPSASKTLSSQAPLASIASNPASVTIAIRPSSGVDGYGYKSDLGFRKTRIFFQMGLDR